MVHIKKNLKKTPKTLCIKLHYQESEKTTHRIGEIFANHIPDKVLKSRIHKNLLQLNNKKQPYLKMGKGLD